MKLMLPCFLCVSLAATVSCLAQRSIMAEQESHLEAQGRFKQLAAFLTNALAEATLPASQRKRLAFELDRLDRIRKDFALTKDELFTALKKSVKGLTADEFERWVAEGRFDSREIDGLRRFMGSSVSNLFFRYPELNARRLPPKDSAKHDTASWEMCLAIKQAALAGKKPYVLPKRFRATMTVTAKAGAAPAGETISAWLPIPREYPFQTDFKLLKTSSPLKHI